MGLRFKELRIWQDGMEITEIIYKITKKFPESEKFGLANQLQRAAVSIPSNIAEGSGRNSKKDFAHFLSQARGSIYEIITQLEISSRVGITQTEEIQPLIDKCESLTKQISALINSLRT